MCCFQTLSSGVICYTAIDNEHRACDKWKGSEDANTQNKSREKGIYTLRIRKVVLDSGGGKAVSPPVCLPHSSLFHFQEEVSCWRMKGYARRSQRGRLCRGPLQNRGQGFSAHCSSPAGSELRLGAVPLQCPGPVWPPPRLPSEPNDRWPRPGVSNPFSPETTSASWLPSKGRM